jgi:hypothetical protein
MGRCAVTAKPCQRTGGVEGVREGFLAEHGRPCLDAAARDREVGVGRRTDPHGVDASVLDQIVEPRPDGHAETEPARTPQRSALAVDAAN